MPKYEFYHGTSRVRYKSIKEHGFMFATPNYRNWLAPVGVYFIVNRPLVALRFAREASAADDSEPVLLKVPINFPKDRDRVLDLTTDDGMFLLFRGYELARRLYHAPRSKFGPNIPPGLAEYKKSLMDKYRSLKKTLDEVPFKLWRAHENVNWDSLAMEILRQESSIALVTATLHEGITFNLRFTSKQPVYPKARSHKGIRARDHIEVCVMDVACIDLAGITEIDPEIVTSEYDDRGSTGARFVDMVTTQLPDPED